MYLTAAAMAATAAFAWPFVRAERVHAPFAAWATGVAFLQLLRALAPESVTVEVASAGVGSLGLLGACLWVFEGRRYAWLPWLAAVALLGAAHTDVSAAARGGALRAVWAIAAAGTAVCVGRALRRDVEPGLHHLAIMVFAAAAVVRFAIGESSPASGVPMAAAGIAALVAYAGWTWRLARATEGREEEDRDASVVGDGDVDVRGDDRMGDLVDVAEAIRRRREREARARGGIGEA